MTAQTDAGARTSREDNLTMTTLESRLVIEGSR